MDFLAGANIEIARGELWRAKEILHKAVKYAGYDVALYQKLGDVLLKMGDKFEAGKYLFLSGTSAEEFQSSIELFLERYRDKPHNLFHPFPRAAKLTQISEYPAMVADRLREMGFPDDLTSVHQIHRPRGGGPTNKIAFIIFICVLAAILILSGLGIAKLVEIVF